MSKQMFGDNKYNFVIEDIIEVKRLVEELSNETDYSIGVIPNEIYLKLESYLCLCVFKVEFLISRYFKDKKISKPKNDKRSKWNIMVDNSKLSDEQKEWLKYVVYIRDCIAHTGGYVDNGFISKVSNFKHIKAKKLPIGSICVFGPDKLAFTLKLVIEWAEDKYPKEISFNIEKTA